MEDSRRRQWAQGRPSLVSRRAGPAKDVDEVAVAVTVIRRLGYVASKVHHQVMDNLISQGEQVYAELFNNAFKPIVDMLRNFTLEDECPDDSTDDQD